MESTVARPAARQLAEWAFALRLREVPDAMVARVKLHILDQVGAQVSCRNLPTCRLTQNYVTAFGSPGAAAVLGTRLRVDPEFAGLANGTAGSAFEIDDYGGKGANCHPGCAVVPGALAVGEEAGASGAEVLLACVVGFEMVIRLALASMPSLLLERGFHHTSTLGGFAVALQAAMIGGLDIDAAVNAISIAGSHASGVTEYAQTGGEVKRVHGGLCVAGGIRASRLAGLGLSAPPTILEGKRGFLQAFCNGFEPRHLTEDLGIHWHFPERASIKLFASCALMQPHFAALDSIRARHAVGPGEIDHVVLGCDPLAYTHTGGVGPRPTDVLGAQFSAEYSMAMRLVRGQNDVGAYLDQESAGFADAEVCAMADRITLERDPGCTFENPLGRVTLHLRGGDMLTDAAYARGSPGNPVTPADIKQKYRALVSRDFGEATAQRSLDLIMDLENVADLRQLTGLFETPG